MLGAWNLLLNSILITPRLFTTTVIKQIGMREKKTKGHQDESGRPTTNRGKPPHKGGYRKPKPKANWFEIGDGILSHIGDKGKVVGSKWNPGRRN